MNVLVLGASGYIGSNLVPHLRAQGHHVRATARRQEVLEGRGWDGVELVSADALDPASLCTALNGINVAYYLVHSMGSGDDFEERDRTAAENFRIAAETAGVERIIYLGGLQPPGESTRHLRSRQETGNILRAGPVPVTELRAGIIVGAGSAAFEVIRDLVNHLPVMTTPRWVRSRTQPIALQDLLDYLSRLLEIPVTEGKTYDVGGPETLSYEEMIAQFAAAVGKRRWVIPVTRSNPSTLVLLARPGHERSCVGGTPTHRWAQARPPRRRRSAPRTHPHPAAHLPRGNRSSASHGAGVAASGALDGGLTGVQAV